MGATTARRAGAVEILRLQVRNTAEQVQLNVAGVTHEESLVHPHPGGNCMNWVVGHLLWVHELALPLLGQAPVLERDALARYVRGTPALRDPAEAIDLRALLRAWEESVRRLDAGLVGLAEEELDHPPSHLPGGEPGETLGSFLAGVVQHQAYHAGQLGILRRLVGKEGAIP